jgi:hypothetical protein
MKNFIINTLLLLSIAHTTANNTPIIANQEVLWSTVLDMIEKANVIFSTGAIRLSEHIKEKYLDQKPILITKTTSEETITHTFNIFYTSPLNTVTQKTLLTIEYNTKDGTVQFKDHLLGLIGLNCSITLPQAVNSNVLKASINFEVERAKIEALFCELGCNI